MATAVQRFAQGAAARNRRMAFAVLVSLLLHALLLIPSDAWRLGAVTDADTTPLTVHIEPAEAPDPEGGAALDEPPEVAEAVAPAPAEPAVREEAVAEGRVVARIEERLAHVEPVLPQLDEDATSEVEEPADTAAPVATEPPVEPLVAAEPPVEPLEAVESPAEPPVVATLAPSHQAVLTRRLEREARELLESRAMQSRLSFEHDDREFTAMLTRRPAADGTDLERVTVEITTEHEGAPVRTRFEMKRLAFSHFTQLVDRWDPWVAMHDDEIVGRFHSNSEILLTYDREAAPRLRGKVTTVRGVRIAGEQGWRPRSRIFAGGLATRTPRVRLPELALPIAHETATRGADVHVVRTDARIVFHADGGYDRIELASGAAVRRRLPTNAPAYIVGAQDAELHVRGTVRGNVTLYSPRRIVIEGDLTCARDPRTGGSDFLGLVSDGNVEIAPASVTGPGDLAIHAAIYARGRFVVRNVNARGRATLTIYGSLTAGSVSATEPRYATRIEFDPRLEHVRPPGFPETDRYEIEAWDGSWRLAEATPAP